MTYLEALDLCDRLGEVTSESGGPTLLFRRRSGVWQGLCTDVPGGIWEDQPNISERFSEFWLSSPPCAPSPEGLKYDTGKPRWDLIPFGALDEMTKVLTAGSEKYSDDNWRKIANLKRRYTRAGLGHVFSWVRGERLDPETDCHHLAHALCCFAFILEVELGGEIPEVFNNE